MRDYQLVSADSHLEAPPVWVERLPADLREKAPQIVSREDGDGIILNGNFVPASGLALTAGHRYSEIRPDRRRYSEEHGASSDPAVRIKEQDEDGVDAEGLFPAVANIINKLEEPRLLVESVRAYNDWLSEYCAYAPDRLFGLALVPFTGIDDAVAELRRVAKNPGIRGAWLLRFPSGKQIATPEDDKFWAAAEEIGITVTAHHNFGGTDTTRVAMGGNDNEQYFAWLLTCDIPVPTIPIATILQLMLTGVMDRHPKLRFFFAESGIGWLPYWLEQMDDRYERHRHWPNIVLPRLPSQYIRDQVHFSFQEDHAGIKMRHEIGVDNISWASDFPHAVGDWPWSREVAARQMRGIPNEDRRKIQALNHLEWLRVITPQDKERLAKEPVKDTLPAELAPRLARRM